MEPLVGNTTFVVYALTCVVLCLNLLVLWGLSGGVRGKTKTAINPEDAARFGGTLKDVDPPEVARVLRAHANAQANIYPFLLLGLVFVLAGGMPMPAMIIFGVFVFARICHSIVYLAGKQPWRTAAFIVGGIATMVLMVDVVLLLVRGVNHG